MVKQVSEELGVRYVLEGSVQRSGNRIRITGQLIDALTAQHISAERYDRDLKDIFILEDEITVNILTATQVKLTTGEVSLGDGKHYKGKQGLDCYLKILEGSGHIERQNSEDNNLARQIAMDVIAMCPEVPMAYQLMGWVYVIDYWLGTTKSPQEFTEKGIEMIKKALALDDTLAEAHAILSHLYTQKREYDKSIAEGKRAVAQDYAGGYCFINNAAVAANWLSSKGHVAVLDVDYHCGNGTQDIFYDRHDVFTISIHADPDFEYPHFIGFADERGEGGGCGFHHNFPLPKGTDDAAYLETLNKALELIRDFKPAYLVISAGMDIYADDPLGTIRVSRDGIGEIGKRIASLDLPTVILMEGGYANDALGKNILAFVSSFV